LVVEQELHEVAAGFLHCALYIFVTVKFRAIVNMPMLGGGGACLPACCLQ
jgi:hypothetical protein